MKALRSWTAVSVVSLSMKSLHRKLPWGINSLSLSWQKYDCGQLNWLFKATMQMYDLFVSGNLESSC